MATTPSIGKAIDTGYKYILAYGVFFAGILLLMKSKVGYNIIYYSLALGILLLLLIESKFIAQALQPIGGYIPITGDVANAQSATKG